MKQFQPFKIYNFSYTKGLYALFTIYLLLYGWFLWYTNYLPYVLDNNESFSAFGHAYNLFHGDFFKTFWLTDETFHPSSHAHPMIHTHQGDWPRVFAYLMYLLGARNIESHIIIATFSIGLLAIWFMYHFFFKVANGYFALLACVIMMTDYMFFAQWQVNTYRVWHVFFIFSSLLCVHGIGSARPKLWALLTFLNSAALFYGELIFAAFITVWSGLYTVALYPRHFKRIALGGISQLLGAVFAISLLLVQLTAFMGWDNVVTDLSLTFVARNATADKASFIKTLDAFYNHMNIVFFYNIQDGSQYRNISSFVTSFFQYGFQIYSAYFSIIVLMLFSSWCFNVSPYFLSNRQRSTKDYFRIYGLLGILYCSIIFRLMFSNPIKFMGIISNTLTLMASVILVCNYSSSLGRRYAKSLLILAVYAFLVILSDSYFDFKGGVDYAISLVVLPIISFIFSVYALRMQSIMDNEGHLHNSKILLTIIYISGSATLFSFMINMFDNTLKDLWLGALSNIYSGLIWFLVIIFVFMGTSLSVLLKNKQDSSAKSLSKVGVYLTCGFFAFVILYLLSPGYVFSGYLTRYCPFHVFLLNVMVSVALYTFINLSIWMVKIGYAYWPVQGAFFFKKQKGSYHIIFLGINALALILAVPIIFSQWIYLQYKYLQLLPPDVFNFAKLLKENDKYNKTAVSNTYAMPFAVQLNNWAYHDPGLASGKLRLDNNGYHFHHDSNYLWYADRNENKDYQNPDLFICYASQGLHTALARYLYPNQRMTSCSNYPIVRQALGLQPNKMKHKLLKRDESNDDMWAIIEIGKDFPPYLAEIEGDISQKRVKVSSQEEQGSTIFNIQYRYKQQNNNEEGSTLVELHRVIRNKYSCSLQPLLSAIASGGETKLKLPGIHRDKEFVVSVTPASKQITGDKWFSDVINTHNKNPQTCNYWLSK